MTGTPGRLMVVQHLSPDRMWGYTRIREPFEIFVFAFDVEPERYTDIRVPDGELLDWGWFTLGEGVKRMDVTNAALLTAAFRVAGGELPCAYLEDDQLL
ncbi:hypothetical protein GCM10010218_13040 [Streptomyces mashuensis]|uniref:Uncharacterized protein n=1 Tax=Streptomyces mashuensis TaxID=33904 RepID=A0A919AZ06_9ACTN|nr:hypothetical protein GCM10010218_13040 [Streptomyces mashuensis]